MPEGSSETMRVASVNVSEETRTTKHPAPAIVIDEDGVQGDGHAGPGHRQVSLLARESIDRFSAEENRRFQPGEFAENITTEGVDPLAVAVLDRFTIGSVELEVTQIGKACHGDTCAIYREVGRCVMPKEGIFCRVIHGGLVKPGEAVIHTPRALRIRVITMSDRASRGEYEDRSGPRVRSALEEFFADGLWRLDIEAAVLPDDGQRLEADLSAAREAGIDVVFTTGGTGVGPRDVTPDVVTAMADKLIPGVMEHIRLKFGKNKPNALLSRSVAAVLGRTLVYTLPGGATAIDEYMGEILKTLEHLIYMLHGLDVH